MRNEELIVFSETSRGFRLPVGQDVGYALGKLRGRDDSVGAVGRVVEER
jgi:hypothetical protein